MNEEENVLVLTNDIGKKCTKCGRFLSQYHYYRKRGAADHLQDWCIDCQKQYKLERKAKLAVKKARIEDFTIKEFLTSVNSLDRGSLIILRKIFTTLLKLIDRKLK